jgi:hypothetical protein
MLCTFCQTSSFSMVLGSNALTLASIIASGFFLLNPRPISLLCAKDKLSLSKSPLSTLLK